MSNLLYLFSFVFGLIVGSFLNVVTLRLPNDQSIRGRSRCSHCGHVLASKDLVPVLSFLYIRGKCRYCKTPLSNRYILLELVTGLLFALVAYLSHPVTTFDYVVLLRDFIAVSVLLVVFITDFEHYLIFDTVVFWGLGFITAFNIVLDIITHPPLWYASYTVSGIIGAVVPSFILYLMWKISKGRWLGFGDVKFMLFIGMLLGSIGVIVGFFLSFVLGALISLPLLVFDKAGLKTKLPLGCFFAVGTFITMFWGTEIIHWYLTITGFYLY